MIESIEKLREFVDGQFVSSGQAYLQGMAIAGSIEREVAERYMLLPEGWTTEQASEIIGYWPKWDDGKPCMFGDRCTTPKYAFEENVEKFDRLVVYARDHVFKHADGTTYEGEHGGYYEWNYFRPGGDGCEEYRPHHAEPDDPLKKLLKEFGDWYKHVAGGCDELGVVDDYAERIRELMEVDV